MVSDQIFPSFIAGSQITIVNLFDRFAIYFLRSSSISRRIHVFIKFIKDTFSRGNFINSRFLSRLYFSKFLVIFTSLSIIRRLNFPRYRTPSSSNFLSFIRARKHHATLATFCIFVRSAASFFPLLPRNVAVSFLFRFYSVSA